MIDPVHLTSIVPYYQHMHLEPFVTINKPTQIPEVQT